MGEGRAGVVLASVAAISAAVAALAGTWQAWIAHDAEIRQIRSYLYVDFSTLKLSEGVASTEVIVRPLGQTPAYDVRVDVFASSAIVSVETDLPNPESHRGWPRHRFTAMFGEPVKIAVAVRDAAAREVREPAKGLYVRGAVRYRDVFMIERRLEFCRVFTTSRPEGGQDGCRAEHNQAD